VNCYNHPQTAAVGVCALCQKAVCRQCVGADSPRIVCGSCLEQRPIVGFEYRSAMEIGGWPLIHVCAGTDPLTMRPRVAKGVIAIGQIAVGVVAIGAVAVGGLALGFMYAIGGAAFAPAVIDGRHCDQDALDFVQRWIGSFSARNCQN